MLKEFCHDLCRARYRSAHRTPEQRERLRRYFRERDRKIRAAKQAQKRKPWTKAQVLAVLQHDPYADWEVVYSEETEGTTTPHTVLTC